jgi:hypothetical protein
MSSGRRCVDFLLVECDGVRGFLLVETSVLPVCEYIQIRNASFVRRPLPPRLCLSLRARGLYLVSDPLPDYSSELCASTTAPPPSARDRLQGTVHLHGRGRHHAMCSYTSK